MQFLDPSEEFLSRSSSYKALLDQTSLATAQAAEATERAQRLQAENEELRASRQEFEEQYMVINA